MGWDAYRPAISHGEGAVDDGLGQEGVVAAAIEFLMPYGARASKVGDPGVHFEVILEDGGGFVLEINIGRDQSITLFHEA